MNQFKNITLAFLVALCASCGEDNTTYNDGSAVRTDSRPNIIFIFTDDQGYADVGAYNEVSDIKTPNIDQLAYSGVRMTDGYVTSPQCSPSRAALMTGKYPQSFGFDDNRYGPLPLSQTTIADKLHEAGYVTGMAGKWHLDINKFSQAWYEETYGASSGETLNTSEIPSSEKAKYYPENRGFHKTFFGNLSSYRANFNLDGLSTNMTTFSDRRFRVDVVSDAAVSFIKQYKNDPFFLYVPYFAPHVPLEATEKYLARFPGDMAERRRYALAMMSAIDEGVGRIVSQLEALNIRENTVIFFMSDNGAPLAMTKEDVAPVTQGGALWDGSLNTPWLGEKGMLTDGGIRVPYIVNWKGQLPEGLVYEEPVISIDASATAMSIAGITDLDTDGVNLIPYLKDTSIKPDRSLYWRFWEQSAIRKGKWKYLLNGTKGEYLFDMSVGSNHEQENLISSNPELVTELRAELESWADTLPRSPGISTLAPNTIERQWYDYHVPD